MPRYHRNGRGAMNREQALSIVNARLIQLQSDRQDYQDELLGKQADAIRRLQKQGIVGQRIDEAIGLKPQATGGTIEDGGDWIG